MGARLQHTRSTRAFRGLYVEHYGFVWGIARRMGVRPDAVDDVVQDAFLTAFRRLSDLPCERPRAWLYGITRRVSSNYRRQERRRTRKHDALAAARPAAVEVEGQLAAGRAVDRFLDGLDENDRELFVLGEIEGLTGVELAAALQARPSTLYGRLRVLRERFRQDVGAAGPQTLRARAAGRPRASAARWALLQPLLVAPAVPAVGLGVLGAGAVWGKFAVGAAAVVMVAGASSPIWGAVAGASGEASASGSRSAATAAPTPTPRATVDVPAAERSLARPEPLAPGGASAVATPAPASMPRPSALARAPRPHPAPGPSDAHAPATLATPSAGVAAEADLVRKARGRLVDGDPRAALELTARHRARFPDGVLVDAAQALRIEALCADGQTGQARGEARAFLRDSPRSPVAARVRDACPDAGKSGHGRNPSPTRTQPP